MSPCKLPHFPICKGVFLASPLLANHILAPSELNVSAVVLCSHASPAVACPAPNSHMAKSYSPASPLSKATSLLRSPGTLSPLRSAGVLMDSSNSLTPSKIPQVRYFTVFVEDNPDEDIQCFFDPACDFIEKNLPFGNVLICNAGDSRSTTIAIAFLMKHRGLSFVSAFDRLIHGRGLNLGRDWNSGGGAVIPNPGFQRQLIAYAKLLGPSAMDGIELEAQDETDHDEYHEVANAGEAALTSAIPSTPPAPIRRGPKDSPFRSGGSGSVRIRGCVEFSFSSSTSEAAFADRYDEEEQDEGFFHEPADRLGNAVMSLNSSNQNQDEDLMFFCE